MRDVFVHEARLALSPDDDERALGAAVTVALCGHWEHSGGCRWPHLSTATRHDDSAMSLRTVFAADPEHEPVVRERIARALDAGRLDSPGGTTEWSVLQQGSAAPTAEDRAWAEDQQRE
jgi:hypothetical protein